MMPLKIVHVVATLRKGGAERFVVDLCNELAKSSSHEVFLLSLKDNEPGNSFVNELAANVKYHSFGKKAGFSLKVLYNLFKFVDKINPQIVHSHLNAFEYILPSVLTLNQVTRFFHTLHSKADKECPNVIIKYLRKYFYKTNQITAITISQDGRTSFRDYYGVDQDQLIANGRPDIALSDKYEKVKSMYKTDDSYLLINVGRIVKLKNQELLVQAIKQFNLRNERKIRLIVIGDNRESNVYESLIMTIDNDPLIKILGEKSNIGDYLKISDAFCLTSQYEGMPISVIEALSMGCIPICTPVGGIPEMIQNEITGFLSSKVTVESFLNALERFDNHRDKSQMAVRCRLSFETKYHISVCANNYLNVYKSGKEIE